MTATGLTRTQTFVCSVMDRRSAWTFGELCRACPAMPHFVVHITLRTLEERGLVARIAGPRRRSRMWWRVDPETLRSRSG